PTCRLETREFVNFVKQGTVRVIGRTDWIMSRAFRNNHPYEGAKWVPEIDDALRSIATEDELRPFNSRRVVLAEDERGYAWADKHIEENPDIIGALYSAISAPNASEQFPVGVIETAMKSSVEAREVVRKVVRDAYNHDAAIAQSGTKTPFL